MSLANMADIGGCRAAVKNIKQIYLLKNEITSSQMKHLFKDYVKKPKSTGYRGIHLVYKYKSDKNTKYNDYLIEIQIRTILQHSWATAIETIDFFLNKEPTEKLKTRTGDLKRQSFFRKISQYIAIKEDEDSLENFDILDIQKIIKELKVILKLEAYRVTIDEVGKQEIGNSCKFTVLHLNKKIEFLNLRIIKREMMQT